MFRINTGGRMRAAPVSLAKGREGKFTAIVEAWAITGRK